MVEDLLRYLEQSEGPLAYALLALCAAVEYVVPPFPGDTVTLFGIFLATTAGYSVALVYGGVTLGSIAGSLVAWGFGRFLADRRDRWPRFMQGEGFQRAVAGVQARFERHGPAYLALNRFVPALRAFFFVAAGLSRMEAWKVVLYGGLSAAAWNGVLVALGFAVGRSWETLRVASERYTLVTLAVVAAVAIAALIRHRRRR